MISLEKPHNQIRKRICNCNRYSIKYRNKPHSIRPCMWFGCFTRFPEYHTKKNWNANRFIIFFFLSFLFSPTLPVLHSYTHYVLRGAHRFERIKLDVKWIIGIESERDALPIHMWSINVFRSINWRTTVLLNTLAHTICVWRLYEQKRRQKEQRTEEQKLEWFFIFLKRIQEL